MSAGQAGCSAAAASGEVLSQNPFPAPLAVTVSPGPTHAWFSVGSSQGRKVAHLSEAANSSND